MPSNGPDGAARAFLIKLRGKDMQTAIDEVMELERQRCAACLAGDEAAIAAMYDDGMVYVHNGGNAENKAQYLATFRRAKYLKMERGELTCQVHGDTALLTGPFFFEATLGADPTVLSFRAFLSQVFIKRDGAWRYILHQSTPIKS